MEDGLRGIVALMKMSESRLRYCWVSTSVRGDEPSEYGDGVVEDPFDGKDVVIGESMTRLARGEVGRPYGVDIVKLLESVQVSIGEDRRMVFISDAESDLCRAVFVCSTSSTKYIEEVRNTSEVKNRVIGKEFCSRQGQERGVDGFNANAQA